MAIPMRPVKLGLLVEIEFAIHSHWVAGVDKVYERHEFPAFLG